MIKRILVGLGTSSTAESVTRHAIDIAKPHSAELVGLAITDPSRLEWTGPRPMGVGVTAASADLVRHRVERAAADIQATSKKYADFWDYRMEMADIAERHPSLSAEQCYLLATGNTQAVKRSVAEQTKKKLALKKAARTETRSTSGEKVTERKEFKTVKEAGLAAAKKLGLIS